MPSLFSLAMKLKISNITNLQDARYSAAVGFDMISFCMERGNQRKLSPNLIWSMAEWLEGPEIALEVNAFSMEELEAIGTSLQYQWVICPAEEWEASSWDKVPGLVARIDVGTAISTIEQLKEDAIHSQKPLQFECVLNSQEEFSAFEAILPISWVNLPRLELAQELYAKADFPALGLSIREEGEESIGMLNYEGLDELTEMKE